jgi:hypothetical protein
MTELRGQEAWSLALLQAWGQHEEARRYLEQLNRVQRAFGRADYEMPAPASVGLPDLVTVDARVVPVSDVLGEQVERELRRTMELQGDAARAARAASLRPQPASRFSQSGIAIARKSA